jgi:hypothetical protein
MEMRIKESMLAPLKKIAFQKSNDTIQFCSYSIEKLEQKVTSVYLLQYTKGHLGDFNDWDCFISENETEITEFVNEIEHEYPNTIIASQTVIITISIDIKFLTLKNIPESELAGWIHRAIEYTCFNTGLGAISEVESKINKRPDVISFCIKLDILYHPKLVTVLQDLMATWGIDFSENKNSITISLKS